MSARKFCFRQAIVWAALIVSTGASAFDVPKVQLAAERPVIRITGDMPLQVVNLQKFKVALADGEPAGARFSGRWCEPQGVLPWTTNVFGNLAPRAVKAFREQLGKFHYRVAGDPDELFSDSEGTKVDLEIGALVTNLVVTHCQKSNAAAVGGVFMKVKWQVYSPQAKQVVFQAITEGSSQNLENEDLLRPSDRLIEAFRLATNNLLAEAGFHDLVTKVDQKPASTAPSSAPARLRVARVQALQGGLNGNIESLRAAVVTVSSAAASGSGFFISPDGYLITNQHVVGDARYVKVKLLAGRELVGEVMQAHTIRDIALVKTEPVDSGALPTRGGDATIGEDVYVLGSPFGADFSGSLTKGVLGGYRDIDGLRYLQSDVSILPGSSGGPLLDKSGAVIGIARLRSGVAGGNLNLFIPISDALDQLGIELGDR